MMREGWAWWALLGMLAGCGAHTLGPDVPLARDCSAQSRALDVCDVTDAGCQRRIFEAVACFADRDPGEQPTVSWSASGRDYLDPFLPAVVLEPEMIEALRIMQVRGATLALEGRLPQAQPLVSAHEDPLRVVGGELAALEPLLQIHAVAEGFGLALLLRERSREAWLEPSRGNLDHRMGVHAILAGRAVLHADFVVLATVGSALDLGGAPYRVSFGTDGAVGWVDHLRYQGAHHTIRAFYEGGDPALAALLTSSVSFARVGERQQSRAAAASPTLGDIIRVPDDHTVRASFVGGVALAFMVAPDAWFELSGVTDRVAIVGGPDRPVVAWVVDHRDLPGNTAGRVLVEALAAREVPTVHTFDDDWDVLVVGTSSTAELVASTVLSRLP